MSGSFNIPILYTYFRSSCSARVRTACNLKQISVSHIYINILQQQQYSADYCALNPCATVPTFIIPADCPANTTGREIVVRQSIAILELLEDLPAYSHSRKLLPTDPFLRAQVRELVGVVAADTQPPSNQHVLKRVGAFGGDSKAWAVEIMTKGLQAYDELVRKYGGQYSVGDEITMADVCLAPAVEGALRWGVDLESLPNVKAVYDRIKVWDEFVNGDWKHQDDTPAELRA